MMFSSCCLIVHYGHTNEAGLLIMYIKEKKEFWNTDMSFHKVSHVDAPLILMLASQAHTLGFFLQMHNNYQPDNYYWTNNLLLLVQ